MNISTDRIIAAVRRDEDYEAAIKSEVSTIFLLHADIMTIKAKAEAAREKSVLLYVHMDLAEGIGKDKAGIQFLADIGVDGIISTRSGLIKTARELGLYTVQRFFIVDSQSINTVIETVKASKADMIEVMPGIVSKEISKLKQYIKIPIIAGGLFENAKEINEAFEHGAMAVSIGKPEFWN